MAEGRRLGVAPLCAIDATPAEYISTAGAAGFDFVGIRLYPVTEADIRYTPGGREFAELRRIVAGSGVEVLDIEVFRMGAATSRDDWMPTLEMGAELSASLVNVVGADPELSRVADNIAALTRDATPLGITPVIEPIAYLPLDSYDRAVEIAIEAGCAVELDGLHALRTGLDPNLVARHRELFPVFQLCDAPAELRHWSDDRPPEARPQDEDMVIESRLNRLLPGLGDSPLRELLELIGPDVPIAVEVPNLELQRIHDTASYMRLLHEKTLSFLGAP